MGAGRRDLGTAPSAHWHCNFQGSAGNPDPFSYSWAQGVGGQEEETESARTARNGPQSPLPSAGWQDGGGGIAGISSSPGVTSRWLRGCLGGWVYPRGATADSCVRPRGRGGPQPLGRDASFPGRAGRRRARFRAAGPVRHHQAQGSTMDAQKLNPPSKGLKSRETLSRSVHIAEGPHPERSGQSTLSEHGISAAPSASLLKQPATLSQEEKEAIQKRAEGRAKVPPKFRDSIKRFFFSPTGALKIIRLVSRESW